MTAYYNEIDPAAVAVLRQLIDDGVIAPGIVDPRSIKDVQPDGLAGFTQCHFFAGGGLWSVAARMAGWPDDRPLWTGSCPCQPFSAAGKGLGTDDPRHLWPDFHRLIRACRPPVVMGEQVAGAAGYGWFDGVRADLAREGFASRPVDIPALSIDAPHERNRLYWIAVADCDAEGRLQCQGPVTAERRWTGDGDAGDVAYDHDIDRRSRTGRREGRIEPELRSGRPAAAGTDASGVTLGDRCGQRLAVGPVAEIIGRDLRQEMATSAETVARNGSLWAEAEWIVCHDGKARRTKPGLPLLVDGVAGRVPAWRLAGNSIVAPLAAEVIRAFLDVEQQSSGRLAG